MTKKILGIDFDGTIHDCVDLYAEAGRQAEQVIGRPVKDPKNPFDDKKFWDEYLVQLKNMQKSVYQMLPGTKKFLEKAYKKYHSVVVVSGSDPENIRYFFTINNLPVPRNIIQVRKDKVEAIKQLGCTTYVGDMVIDAEGAVGANARFIGFDHPRSFEKPQQLMNYRQAVLREKPEYPIFIVESLEKAINHFE